MTAVFMSASVAAALQFDLAGRLSYALEKGRLDADYDHLSSIGDEDVAAIEKLSHAFSKIVEAAKPSVVYIEALSENTSVNRQLEDLFGKHNFQPEPSTGTGSGVIIDNDGHIVTNNHVIEDASTVRVVLADGRKYWAKVIGSDPMTDVAVIKIDGDRLHPARFADSSLVTAGQIVLAIGSPFRLGHSVSHGIVSAVGRSNVAVDIDYQNWIQTDAPINPGNSGGPLINGRGDVVGINTAIATESGGNQGVGFAIPSNVVRMISSKLKTGQKIVRGYLGITIKPVDPQVAGAYGLDRAGGVLVEQVGATSPAAASGLMPEDIILMIDGARLSSVEDLQQIIAATEPHNSVEMKVWRGGETRTMAVKVGEQPQDFSTSGSLRDLMRPEDNESRPRPNAEPQPQRDEPISSTQDGDGEPRAYFKKLGFEAGTVSPKLTQRFKLGKEIQNGAVVTQVESTSEAYAAGIRSGHTIIQANGRRIHNVRELEQEVTPEAIKKGIRLKIRWRSSEFFAVLKVQ